MAFPLFVGYLSAAQILEMTSKSKRNNNLNGNESVKFQNIVQKKLHQNRQQQKMMWKLKCFRNYPLVLPNKNEWNLIVKLSLRSR